jgi:phosphatidylinositol glycan class K
MTSHGGNEFLRIRTKTVILSDELDRTLWEMFLKNRYKEILFIVDTCEAITSYDAVTAPNIYFVGSSLKDQKALSYGFDNQLMTPLSDRFTYLMGHFLETLFRDKRTNYKIDQLFERVADHNEFMNSEVGVRKGVEREVSLAKIRSFYQTISATITLMLTLLRKILKKLYKVTIV